MPSFQPYHDVPGIEEYDGCLPIDPPWVNIDLSLNTIDSPDGHCSSHAWYTQRRLHDLQDSFYGCNHTNHLDLSDGKFSRLGLQSLWNPELTDSYRHIRYFSPGGAYGVTSTTDSTTSEDAFSFDSPRQHPALSQLASVNHHTYCSPATEFFSTTSYGSWMPQTSFSTGPSSPPDAASDHSACNLKELQYSRDEETEEEQPSATAQRPPFLQNQPEEVAFADEGLGRSVGDENSSKDSEEDELEKEGAQASDVDSDYNPGQTRKQSASHTSRSRPGRSSPRHTRSLQSATSPILSPNNRITKPTPTRHRRFSSSSSSSSTTTTSLQKPAKHFPCTFSLYGCRSIFASKNEWKRHVSSQHLQLGFYRCDAGFCNPALSSSSVSSSKSKRGEQRSHNDFNRKDLFTQHHRRMHLPFAGKCETASGKQKAAFEAGMEEVRRRCWVVRRQKPARASCGVCQKIFVGEKAWEERMEHLGKHFECGEGVDGVGEDEFLTRWAVEEGLVVDHGSAGRWLLGMQPATCMEPGAGYGNGGSPSRRGRRIGSGTAVKRED